MKVISKIHFVVAICLLSLAFVFLIQPGQHQTPLSPFVDFPLWFLGSFLIQPAFCWALVQQYDFDFFAILALVINAAFFTNVFYTVWRSQKPPKSVIIQNYFIGLVINFGNFVLALMSSV